MTEVWKQERFLDWGETIGLKGSHGNEPAAPKTRGRKGQSTPDPKKARAFDHSDVMARELDRIGSAMLRGTCPSWIVEALGADDYRAHGRTADDHAMATAHVSRWRSIPQVIDLDASVGDAWIESEEGLSEGESAAPEPSFEYVSENARAKPLRLETTVRTIVGDDGRITTRVYRPSALVRGPKARTMFVGHGPAVNIDAKGSMPKTTANSRVARGSDRRDAAVAALATLAAIGDRITLDDWHVSIVKEATKRHAAVLKATRGETVVTGPPRKVASIVSR